jgi:hypothetical protein
MKLQWNLDNSKNSSYRKYLLIKKTQRLNFIILFIYIYIYIYTNKCIMHVGMYIVLKF